MEKKEAAEKHTPNLPVRQAGYRDAIVGALNKTVAIFTSHSEQSFNEVVCSGLQPVAEAAGLNRIAVYRLLDKESGRIGQIYVWAYGKTVALDETLLELPNVPPVIRWLEILRNGECVHGNVQEMIEDQAEFCGLFGIKTILFVPIFTHSEFWGIVTLEDHTNYRYFDDDCLDLLRSAARLCANAFIRNEMTHNIGESIEALKRRKNITDTLHKTAIKFLSQSEETFENMMNSGMGLIVNAANLDRLSVWRNFNMSDGLHSSQIYRWDKEAGGTTKPTTGLENVTYAKFAPRWEKLLASNEVINGPVHLMPEAVMLQSFGVVSAFVAPVIINNIFWGFVLFEDRHIKRYFDEDSVEMMRSAAFLCANTVMRADMEKRIREQNELLKIRLDQQELLSEISRGFIASGDSQTYVKEAITKLGRYHKVSAVFLFSVDYQHDKIQPAYYWSDDGQPPHIIKSTLFATTKACFPESLPESATLPILACEDIAASSNKSYRSLLSVNVNSFICAPLYVEGRLWGILSVEHRFAPRKWTENEKSFVAMTASTIAGVIMRDIYNTMLKNALHKATMASRAKGEFLSNMSHEMRTPLNAIIGMTTLIKNAKNQERKDYALSKIEDASTHLLGVINDVLDMSKIEANKFELSPDEFNFEKMLKRVVNVINFRVDEKQQKLTVHIDTSIPKILIGDEQRIAQIIANLLGNAVKFTHEKGSINLDTRFLGEKNGLCTIRISVSDTGIGISAEQQTRLFQSFQQAENSTVRKYGGTGLGLAISKNIVELMGGTIQVESELEKGSTFTFTIRVKRGNGKKQELLAGTMAAPDINGLFKGRRILLAEDVDINREIVAALLEPTLLEIDCAENGVQAVKMFDATPDNYDLIFMDLQMPEMDGYEATRRIRALEIPKAKTIPIIAMTANVFKEDIERCIAAGMNSHLGKPLHFDEVLEKLRYYLP